MGRNPQRVDTVSGELVDISGSIPGRVVTLENGTANGLGFGRTVGPFDGILTGLIPGVLLCSTSSQDPSDVVIAREYSVWVSESVSVRHHSPNLTLLTL